MGELTVKNRSINSLCEIRLEGDLLKLELLLGLRQPLLQPFRLLLNTPDIGNLLPNNQRQHRTCYTLCHMLYLVSAAHTSIFRLDSNSTSYS